MFDTTGNAEILEKSAQILKKHGVLVSMMGTPSKETSEKYEITAISQMTVTDNKHLNILAELIDSGKVKIHFDKIFLLDQIKEAFEYQE